MATTAQVESAAAVTRKPVVGGNDLRARALLADVETTRRQRTRAARFVVRGAADDERREVLLAALGLTHEDAMPEVTR